MSDRRETRSFIKNDSQKNEHVCKFCLRNFYTKSKKLRKDMGFCSNECKYAHFGIGLSGNKIFSCKNCGINFFRKTKKSNNSVGVFCSKKCSGSYMSGKNNPAYGVTYRSKQTHPDWANSIKKTMKRKVEEEGFRIGDSNPMRRPEVAEKMSKTRRKLFKDNPQKRKQLSEAHRKAWREGRHNGSSVGKSKWYNYNHSDGRTLKVQGTWEWGFAKWLDENNIDFVCHREWISYTDSKGNNRNYYPDFYLTKTNQYIDIKARHWFVFQKEKFKNISNSNPDKKIAIICEDVLSNFGMIQENTKKMKKFYFPGDHLICLGLKEDTDR